MIMLKKKSQQDPPHGPSQIIRAPPAIRACLDQPSPATAMAKVCIDDWPFRCEWHLGVAPSGSSESNPSEKESTRWPDTKCLVHRSRFQSWEGFVSKEPLLWLGNDWNTTKSSAKISVGVFRLTCSSVLVSQPSSNWLIPMHSAGKMLTILVVSKLVEALSKRSLFLRKNDHDWNILNMRGENQN